MFAHKSNDKNFVENNNDSDDNAHYFRQQIKVLDDLSNDNDDDYYRLEYKRLLRRIDLYLVVILALIFTVNFLDRVNIGQAKLDGLMDDINLVIIAFFIPYFEKSLMSYNCYYFFRTINNLKSV